MQGRQSSDSGSPLLPPEALLLACTDLRPDDAVQRRIDAALSAPGLDWPEVIRLAIRQGVAASLAWHLRAFAGDSRIPPSIRVILERIYAAHARRNGTMFHAAGRLTRALEQAGIPSLILKGVGLALTAYPDQALRIFSDIDLLVPVEDWEAAGSTAERAGFLLERKTTAPLDYHLPYVCMVSEDILSDCLAPEFEPAHGPDALGEVVHRIVVEIHRSAFTLPGGFTRAADLAPLWENPRSALLPDGTPILIPAPEAMIVHLATHAARHRFNRLMFMSDFVLTLQFWQAEIDWDRLVELVHGYGARNPVWRMLELASREFGAPVPTDVLNRLEPGRSAGLDGAPLTASEIFHNMELMMRAPSAITLSQLLRERSARQVFISAANILFPAPSIIGRYYRVRSPLLIAGCYLIRPFQLLGRLAGVLVRSAFVGRSRRIRTGVAAEEGASAGDVKFI